MQSDMRRELWNMRYEISDVGCEMRATDFGCGHAKGHGDAHVGSVHMGVLQYCNLHSAAVRILDMQMHMLRSYNVGSYNVGSYNVGCYHVGSNNVES